MITIAEIEEAIDEATEKVRGFVGSKDSLIMEVINPLQAKLRKGIAAGLNCNEDKIRTKFANFILVTIQRWKKH